MDLWFSDSRAARLFRQHTRSVNNAISLSSFLVNERRFERGTSSVVILGKLTQLIGSLQPEGGMRPHFSQLYCSDPATEATHREGNFYLPNSLSQCDGALLTKVMWKVTIHLSSVHHTCQVVGLVKKHNPLVADFVMACEQWTAEGVQDGRLVISAKERPAGEHERRYNLQVLYFPDPNKTLSQVCPNEVSMLATEGTHHKLILKQRGNGLQEVSDLNLMSSPLHFTLAFPHGTPGWHPDLRQSRPDGGDDERRITPMKFFAYHLNVRDRDQDYLMQMGRLFQELVIFGRIAIDNSRLMYHLTHQKEMRADTYQNLREVVAAQAGTQKVGKKVVLGPSFEGGKRKWNLRYQNGMAIVRKFLKPDLFITFTFNPDCPELRAELRGGQSPQVRHCGSFDTNLSLLYRIDQT
jgi:hypothetical protein